jgi:hypothetical protein
MMIPEVDFPSIFEMEPEVKGEANEILVMISLFERNVHHQTMMQNNDKKNAKKERF